MKLYYKGFSTFQKLGVAIEQKVLVANWQYIFKVIVCVSKVSKMRSTYYMYVFDTQFFN